MEQAILQLRRSLPKPEPTYCQGLFLSARWFAVSAAVREGIQLLVLPDKEAAEYCAADLYPLVEGDRVFFLPDSGKKVEHSNYKSSLSVQRTAALGKIMAYSGGDALFIVTYPEALEECIPQTGAIREAIVSLKVGDEISFEHLKDILIEKQFTRVDFVSQPGQYSIRGSLIDIFSFSNNYPYRISFFGDEVEKIHIFDCNTQLSKGEADAVDIYPDLSDVPDEAEEVSPLTLFPPRTVVWLDSSDMYKERPFFAELEPFKRVFLEVPLGIRDRMPDQVGDDEVRFNIAPQPVFNKNFELLSADIREKLESNYTVRIYGENRNQLERIKSILVENAGLMPEFVRQNLHAGFIDRDDRICCYSDHEIFDRFHRVAIRRSVEKSEQLTLNDITAFNIGDYVVHIDHGVGVFGGLVRMRDDYGRVHEVVKLMYKDGDVVFVSVHSLHKICISQYLKLYAKRKASTGFAFAADSYLQEELESSFIYEDTPDQDKATIAVKRDMEDKCPMDRLICGDVGFGKTEIAIRAAFKAATDGKQVAVLVPTTILALQHYTTFTSRLKDFPVTVDYVSRLRTPKQIADIKERLKAGKIDILIGTHKILGEAFEFKDLGLLIIDEEQKFGVSAKEKLRQMRENIDTLTLTATPIPRTLQFSLLGARDLSIISTPPPNRIPIQTEIILFDEKEIKSILTYELNRGGQIFFLHNKVEQLPAIEDILHRLVPDMRICVAHGQMEPKELENRMLDFMRGDYDLLLCTTIIENGLDIPNANTILINQAQNIGLSDLHQLRGRVGRSNRKAFCYLIVPPLVSITDDARRRLKAIEEFSDLGSGFNIAMQDLDIRGAGNLLGAEQSGFISDMGYETYQSILAEAMEELGVETGLTSRNVRESYVEDCTIETDRPAFIPDEYIDVMAEKIRIYKDLDSLRDDREIDRFRGGIADRFGRLPEELENLFWVVRIRNLGARLGFEKIIIKNGMELLFFIANPMSPYYKSPVFETVLKNVNANDRLFNIKQTENKLKIVIRGVDSLEKAHANLRKLAENM